ncbi:MAG: penicillin acylase family protein [Planctomycetes bacterium]|nr:penicillin acylase family protein [Planctomycetota bacterium]
MSTHSRCRRAKRLSQLCVAAATIIMTTSASSAEPAMNLLERSKSVLAQLDGQIAVPELTAPVEVLRDRWGVPHIYARNQDDLFFAQGFVAAQDRLFQIDLWRRVAVGTTAEVLGPLALEGDRFARLVKYRGDMDAEWTSYSPDTRQIAEAFTRGINAYIDLIRDRLPIEFQVLGFRPGKWSAEDCLGRMSGVIMIRNFREELARAELIAAVGVEQARKLMPTDPQKDFAPAAGLGLAGIDRGILAGYDAATRPFNFKSGGEGSNNWVVDGTLSASGKPLMASDPHRPIHLPSLRYMVHLNAPGWNVIGGGEPGLPGVALGHNDHVAWGFTICGNDQGDLYVEETHPDNPTRYRVGDGWEPMKVVREKVTVRGESQPVELELRFTRHGPVIHEDRARRRAFALRWIGNEPGAAGYLASLALDRAKDAASFVEACKAWKLPSENIVYADVSGNIGWFAAAMTPVRKGWDGLLPVPGAAGEFEWQGFLAHEDLPQNANPAEHFLVTANHNIRPENYRHEIAYDWAPSYRHDRLRQRLTAQTKFTLDDFASMQHENTSLPGQALAKLAKRLTPSDPPARRAADVLATWDGVLSRNSQAGAIYAVWLQELLDGLFSSRVPEKLLEHVAAPARVPVLLTALETPTADWFGSQPETGRDRLLNEAFDRAITRLSSLLSADLDSWSWGKLHTTPFRHPLATLGPEYEQAFNLGPVPQAGDGYTPNATRHERTFNQVSGASYRHILDLADWDRGLATSVPGQSGQLGSPHYDDLLPLWAADQYFPLAFSRAKVEEVTAHRLLLTPQQ